jgi:hypothetical protein
VCVDDTDIEESLKCVVRVKFTLADAERVGRKQLVEDLVKQARMEIEGYLGLAPHPCFDPGYERFACEAYKIRE